MLFYTTLWNHVKISIGKQILKKNLQTLIEINDFKHTLLSGNSKMQIVGLLWKLLLKREMRKYKYIITSLWKETQER